MEMKMFSAVVIILVVLISSTSGEIEEDWKIKLNETLVMTRQLIQLVQEFNKDAWTGDRCDDNPCNDVGCNTGTCYADSNGLPHCVCPCGTSGQFCEIEDSCLKLESPLNGEVHAVTMTEVSATYTCKNNYRLCGPKNNTCASDEKGNITTPVCIESSYAGDANLTVKFGGSTYYFSGDEPARNFNDAQKYCENLGGNLLSVNSADEWNFIKCVLTEETLRHKGRVRRLGLLKRNETWTWTSGEPLTVSYWHKYHANNHNYDCGFMVFGVWAAVIGCPNKENFICEIKNGH